MRCRTALAMLVFGLLAAPAAAGAQTVAISYGDAPPTRWATTTDTTAVDPGVDSTLLDTTRSGTAGAPVTGLRHGAHHLTTSTSTAIAPRQHAGLGQPAAMMVVGLGALVAGAIIGGAPGTIIMVGGAVIGLVGLWEYLQ